MLILTRRIGESIVIDGNIRLKIVEVKGERVRVGIEAPPQVLVDRQEVHERRQQFAAPLEQPACAFAAA
jgi:carbon storage regulator